MDGMTRFHEVKKEELLPVVVAHGMGNSCNNEEMKSIVEIISNKLFGVYARCIPLGETCEDVITVCLCSLQVF